MGILNVTLDSFWDGGKYAALSDAVEHARRMLGEGADIIDIGGESTRPGALPVPEEIERARVLPVVEAVAALGAGLLSIDTYKAGVAREAVARGAAIINDISGLRDPAMREAARDTGAGVILCHMQGTPRDMQAAPRYEDVVEEVGVFFRQSLALAIGSGIDPMCIVFDPGIGFGKSVAHNLRLLRHLDTLAERPLAVGVSRKSFLGGAMEDRLWPAVAITSFAREQGAAVFRVHDVKAHAEALRMTEAILS